MSTEPTRERRALTETERLIVEPYLQQFAEAYGRFHKVLAHVAPPGADLDVETLEWILPEMLVAEAPEP